jgi:hypothetical protein
MRIPREIQARLIFLSNQLDKGIPLEQHQRKLLAKVLREIAHGIDPRIVFCCGKGAGRRNIDLDKQDKIRKVLREIALNLAIAKKSGNPISIAEAIRKEVNFANDIMGYKRGNVITEKAIRRWWDTPKYRKFRNPLSNIFQA